jgi:hypothetical protein
MEIGKSAVGFPLPFASSKVEMPRRHAPTMDVSTSLDTNGNGIMQT